METGDFMQIKQYKMLNAPPNEIKYRIRQCKFSLYIRLSPICGLAAVYNTQLKVSLNTLEQLIMRNFKTIVSNVIMKY